MLRILTAIATLIGVVTVVFLLFFALPSDATEMALGQNADEKTREALKKELGLDLPLSQQYSRYLNDLSPIGVHPLDSESRAEYGGWVLYKGEKSGLYLKAPFLRRSFQNRQLVSEQLKAALPGTVILAVAAMLFAIVFGLILGGLSAYKRNSFIDRLAVGISTLGISIPSYLAAILIAYLFGFVFHRFTGLPISGSLFEYDAFLGRQIAWKNLILPAITLGIRPLAVITQMSRTAFLEVLGKDYVRTARAKGLSTMQVFMRHVLRNSMGPVITTVSGWFASLLAGAVFIEYIFGWKGIGKLTVDALMTSDLPILMGCVLFIATVFVGMNWVVDTLYRWVDPRVGSSTN